MVSFKAAKERVALLQGDILNQGRVGPLVFDAGLKIGQDRSNGAEPQNKGDFRSDCL